MTKITPNSILTTSDQFSQISGTAFLDLVSDI